MQVKPFTNQKVFSFLGNNTLNKLSSHSLTIYTWKTIVTHLHRITEPLSGLAFLTKCKQIIEHHCKKRKEKKSKNIEQDDERLVSESVTLSQFRVKKTP